MRQQPIGANPTQRAAAKDTGSDRFDVKRELTEQVQAERRLIERLRDDDGCVPKQADGEQGDQQAVRRGSTGGDERKKRGNAQLQRRGRGDFRVGDALERPDLRGEPPERQQEKRERPEGTGAGLEELTQAGSAERATRLSPRASAGRSESA